MKVYTGTGDRGKTSLFSGERVAKADVRIDAYGDVDELNAVIGAVVAQLPGQAGALATALQQIQADLFELGAWLATTPTSGAADQLPKDPTLDVPDVTHPFAEDAAVQGGELDRGHEVGQRLPDAGTGLHDQVDAAVQAVADGARHLGLLAPFLVLGEAGGDQLGAERVHARRRGRPGRTDRRSGPGRRGPDEVEDCSFQFDGQRFAESHGIDADRVQRAHDAADRCGLPRRQPALGWPPRRDHRRRRRGPGTRPGPS